jgi:hypothetical protein
VPSRFQRSRSALASSSQLSSGKACSSTSRTSRVSAGASPVDEMATVNGPRRTSVQPPS